MKFLLVLVFLLPTGEPRVAHELEASASLEDCQEAAKQRVAASKKAVPWVKPICVALPEGEGEQ